MHPVAEVESYLQHEDYSLAIRRLLDVCLDADNPLIIRKAIRLSGMYREAKNSKNLEQGTGEIVDTARQILSELSTLPRPTLPPTLLVEADQVSKTYAAGNFTLQPVSLKVASGDVLGVVGENGNGKTTLLRCLAAQLTIDKGEIRHTRVTDNEFYSIKSQVAFIPQRIPKWYGLLRDNLHFSAAIAGVEKERNELMVDFMLERLNLAPYANLTWNQISSGYRTRFEIARVLLQKPSLLILDEPLANLDINAQQAILTDLRFMSKSSYHPMGVVLSSQQLHEVEKIADNVLFIKQGMCLFQTPEKRMDTQTYVLELETSAGRDDMMRLLGNDKISIQFNGGFYTITSTNYSVQEILAQLVQNQVPVTYFRDITYSTKRFFN